ncbi:MAG: phosphoserine phosphatase SerB [Methylocystaceae bacterium]|nr:MAG: phosphoserine phosphatase SerB [Methylocystaceae bacterium]
MSKAPVEHVATFIAGAGRAPFGEEVVARALRKAGRLAGSGEIDWLDRGVAADVRLPLDPDSLEALRDALHSALREETIDVVVQPEAFRRKALLVADMDSTMIGQECVDELAEFAGLRDHIARITERAMRGEIEFERALRERVALLAGLRVEVIDAILNERITPTRGAHRLVATMRAHGAHTALVSGGFTLFAEPIAERLGFHEARANRLAVENGRLTGVVLPPINGARAKLEALQQLRAALGLPRQATLAVGDGANDLDMLGAAGLGVAFHAKPKVAAAAQARIDHADLTALLFAQGYRRADFAER